MKRMVKKF